MADGPHMASWVPWPNDGPHGAPWIPWDPYGQLGPMGPMSGPHGQPMGQSVIQAASQPLKN